MRATRFAVTHRTVILAAVLVSLGLGLATFQSMSRREDPAIKVRTAMVITHWPGASALKIEDLVADPLEKAIAQIDEVKDIISTSSVGMSVIQVDLLDNVAAEGVDQVWDELRAKVMEGAANLPDGCGQPFVNSGFGDVFGVCLALHQRPAEGHTEIPDRDRLTYRELEILAERVEDEIKTIDSVAKVELHGVQDEVIYLEVDSKDWAKIGLTAKELRRRLEARNIVASGGEFDTGDVRLSVRPTGEFENVEQIKDVVISARDGVPVQLDDVPVRIEETYVDPVRTRYRYTTDGYRAGRCILVAVSMKAGNNIVKMGEEIQERVRRLEQTVLPYDVELRLVNDLPRQVDTRIADFVDNLVQAVLIVLAVAFLMMGWRPALVMATAIPLSMIASFMLVKAFDVELEQFSIASLIIALGMIVDNAIVVSDNTVRLMNEGLPRKEACIRGASGLATPILTSTLTTVAAFAPMLTIEGNAGEYVRSLPIVVSTTLLMSFVVAMTVTPVMCYWVLRPASSKPRFAWLRKRKRKKVGAPDGGKAPLYDRSIRWALNHKGAVLGGALIAFLGSTQLLPLIGNQFFPEGERDQLFVHVWLPEGSSITATEEACQEVEDLLRESSQIVVDGEPVERLVDCITMVGTGGPRMMLTSSQEQEYSNYGSIVVNTSDAKLTSAWVEELQQKVDRIVGAQVDVRRFLMGPYVKNPVEFRIIGDDADVLRAKADELITTLRGVPGAANPSSDWKNASYQVELQIDPLAANLAGVTNADVAETLSGLISGQPLTTFREGDHLITVALRLLPENRQTLDDLTGYYVNGSAGKVPLGSVASSVATWQPSRIVRRNQRRTISVGAQRLPGFQAPRIATSLAPELDKLVATMPAGSRWEYGGEKEQVDDSNEKLGGAFSLSAILILLVLVTQYNSFLKPFIVLATVPLAMIGAFVGLFVTGWPLGFMPSLGLISLAGVVINNAIVLIDFIEAGVAEGKPLRQAVAEAGRLRMKPIVLTTLTTIGGMLPLALFGGPLWAGMAWAVIFGLAFSTILTLGVIPTLYTFAVERLKMRVRGADVAS